MQKWVVLTNVREAMLKPPVSSTSVRICWPALSGTLAKVTFMNVVQAVVFGTVKEPRFTVPAIRWKLLPALIEATDAVMLYVPAAGFTLKFSHSPGPVQPTSVGAPSTSTPSVARPAPPELTASVSW